MQIDSLEQLRELELASLQLVGALFGVSRDTVKAGVRRGMPSRQRPGKESLFRRVDAVQWRLEHEHDRGADLRGDQKRDLEIRKLKAQVAVLEASAGELVDRQAIAREVTRALGILRRHLQRLPAKLSPQLPAENRHDLVGLLQRSIDRALDQIVAELEAIADGEEEDEPDEFAEDAES